jgi:hypothetical protein
MNYSYGELIGSLALFFIFTTCRSAYSRCWLTGVTPGLFSHVIVVFRFLFV